MRMRNRRKSDKVVVLMTPLIDCVFLLLIFFLITGMLKRYERLIPIRLADASATIAAEIQEDVFQLAMDRAGQLSAESGKGNWGAIEFEPIDDAETFFATLSQQRGTVRPIQVRIEPGTPFQRVIHMQDLLEMYQFENFRFRIADRGDELE